MKEKKALKMMTARFTKEQITKIKTLSRKLKMSRNAVVRLAIDELN